MDGSASAVCAKHIPSVEVCLANPIILVATYFFKLDLLLYVAISLLCTFKIYIFIKIKDPGTVDVPQNELQEQLWEEDSGIDSENEPEQGCYCYYKKWDDSFIYGMMHKSKGRTIIENLNLEAPNLQNSQVYEYDTLSKSAREASLSNGTYIEAYLNIWNQRENRPFCSLQISLHPSNACANIFMEALMVGKPITMSNRPIAGFFDLSRIEEFTNICTQDREYRCCLFVKGLKFGLKLFRGLEDDSSVVGDIDCLTIPKVKIVSLAQMPSNYYIKGGGVTADFRLLW